MPRIAEMFAFVTEDTGPEDEGIVAHAQQLADQLGKQIRIYKFTGREQIGTIEPRTT